MNVSLSMYKNNRQILTLSSPTVHAKYTPGNQQCRSTQQLRTSCTEELHCRSLPTYFKLLQLLNHSSSLIYPYVNLRITECNIKWVLFIWLLRFDLDQVSWCNTGEGMHIFSVGIIWHKIAVGEVTVDRLTTVIVCTTILYWRRCCSVGTVSCANPPTL